MREIEYDPATGTAKYIGWALPGSLPSQAVWRICRPIFAGVVLSDIRWADGDDAFDNVYDNRAVLSYSSGDFTLEPAVDLEPTGPRPGTVFTTVPLTSSNHELYLNGMRLKLKPSSPSLNEYAISGNTITIGSGPGVPLIQVDDYLVVRFRL